MTDLSVLMGVPQINDVLMLVIHTGHFIYLHVFVEGLVVPTSLLPVSDKIRWTNPVRCCRLLFPPQDLNFITVTYKTRRGVEQWVWLNHCWYKCYCYVFLLLAANQTESFILLYLACHLMLLLCQVVWDDLLINKHSKMSQLATDDWHKYWHQLLCKWRVTVIIVGLNWTEWVMI